VTPTIVGIVNVTEDSFSDGGRWLDPDAALVHARQLVRDGADVIDLGPASSRPGAMPVSAAEEIRRIAGLIDGLHADGIEVSVDSPQADTQRFALAQGVAYLNDIRGFPDPELWSALATHPTRLIVMHQIGAAATADRVAPAAVLASIDRFFERRLRDLESAGIARERLVVDPGMGFFLGSDPEASLAVLRGLPDLKRRFGLPVFVSASRKSFLRRLTGRALDEIGAATLAAELFAVQRGADYVRTHDPRALRDALRVWNELEPSP
jgi:dihydropteroate synthase type 2